MVNKPKEQLAEEYANNKSSSDVFRQAHIKDFISVYDSRQSEIDRLKDIISGKTFHDETEVLKAEIDALKEQIPKWISVEDRLPTPNQVVLIFWDNKITSGSYKNFHNGYFQHGSATQLKVTHWQPLPNLPKQTNP